ncbi:receptor-like protein EIX1 [Bidens hawaiensis]|uniref:receptor-like protein EIX1 n=1 Tax=Bidens hawaiensis TaxID=980011 RepID=UPI00404B3335
MTNKICQKFLHLNLFIFSLLFLWIEATNSTSVGHRHVPAAAHYKCIDKERDALLDFNAHIDQDPDCRLSTWTTEKEEDYKCCNWSGVTCNNQTGHVTQLDLYYYSLGGCNLSQVMRPYSSPLLNSSSSSIDTLYLGDNNLNSSMYPWLLPLTSNKLGMLDLSKNMLDCKSFGNLCSLTSLNFAHNSVAVKLPDFLNNWSGCTSVALKDLYAPFSRFTRSLSDEIQMFSSLEYLVLDHMS